MEPCGKKMMMHLSYERYLNGYSPSRKIEFISLRPTTILYMCIVQLLALANIKTWSIQTRISRQEGTETRIVLFIFKKSRLFSLQIQVSFSISIIALGNPKQTSKHTVLIL